MRSLTWADFRTPSRRSIRNQNQRSRGRVSHRISKSKEVTSSLVEVMVVATSCRGHSQQHFQSMHPEVICSSSPQGMHNTVGGMTLAVRRDQCDCHISMKCQGKLVVWRNLIPGWPRDRPPERPVPSQSLMRCVGRQGPEADRHHSNASSSLCWEVACPFLPLIPNANWRSARL